MGPSPAVTKTWWKEKPVYQIWPASFCDGNGDGVGDITGIISKLDYIKDLGFEVVWLSPIMKSPQVDMGYDISDYQDIHEAYGTLGDFEALSEACHARGLKLVMDLVVNHTSDQHPWFTESASSIDNPKRKWFVWRKGTVDPQTGEKLPPNNWESIFHAWKYDAMTDEWYLHLFCAEQPDLNWENEEVRQAVYEMMRWWLDRGCDGFRVDAIHLISKPGFHDAPHTKDNQYFQPCHDLIAYGPQLKEFLKEMNDQVLSKYDCLSVGEMAGTFDIDTLAPYCLPEERMFQMFFQFELCCMDLVPGEALSVGEWQLSMMKKIIGRWQTGLIEKGGWNALYLENHDQARSISRFASDKPEFRSVSGKLLALLLTSLCGTVYVYQGQELGQINVSSEWADSIEEFQDVSSINWFNDKVALRRKTEGKEDVETADLIDNLRHRARDNARTPVQWTSEENAGFSTGKPWMKVHSDYKEWNAETLAKDPSSILNFYRTALKTRKENHVLIYGNYTDISAGSEEIYSYIREHEGKRALVVLNFSESTVKDWKIVDGSEWDASNLLVSNLNESATTPVEGGKVTLAPYEGRIYLLE